MTTTSSSSSRKRALPPSSAGDGRAGSPAAALTKQASKKGRRGSSSTNSRSADGVLTYLQAPAQAEPISHEAHDVFERLLSPLTVESFLEAHYEPKRPLVVRGHDFGPLLEEGMEGGDAELLLDATPSETISVWTVGAGGKISTARVGEAASAAVLWRAGHSVYCRAPESVERALVAAAVRSLGLGFRTLEEGTKGVVEGEVELFLGQQGHRTPWHLDFQENWTLQLKGRKRWRLLPGVINPVRGATPHYAQAEGVLDPAAEEQLKVHRLRDSRFRYGPPLGSAAVMEVVLEPGDFLYHPAGIWHEVESVGEEDSVSINISLDGLTYADHISGALRQLLMADARFTAMLRTGGPPQDSLGHMDALLREAAGRLEKLAATPEALLPPCTLWGQPLGPLQAAVPEGEEEQVDAGSEDDNDDDEQGEGEEEAQEEELGASFPRSIPATSVLRRNPLATLFALGDTDPDDAEEAADGGDERRREEAFMVHVAYGATGDLTSVLRKKVVLDGRLGRLIGQHPYAQPLTPGQVPNGDAPEGLRTLGALVHVGVLLLEGPSVAKE